TIRAPRGRQRDGRWPGRVRSHFCHTGSGDEMMPRRGVRRGFGLVGFVGLVVTAGASGVSAQQPRSGPPTLEWGVLLEAVLPDSGTAQPASWSQIAARRLRVQWETSQPTPVA